MIDRNQMSNAELHELQRKWAEMIEHYEQSIAAHNKGKGDDLTLAKLLRAEPAYVRSLLSQIPESMQVRTERSSTDLLDPAGALSISRTLADQTKIVHKLVELVDTMNERIKRSKGKGYARPVGDDLAWLEFFRRRFISSEKNGPKLARIASAMIEHAPMDDLARTDLKLRLDEYEAALQLLESLSHSSRIWNFDAEPDK
jgi:hypothetical protein